MTLPKLPTGYLKTPADFLPQFDFEMLFLNFMNYPLVGEDLAMINPGGAFTKNIEVDPSYAQDIESRKFKPTNKQVSDLKEALSINAEQFDEKFINQLRLLQIDLFQVCDQISEYRTALWSKSEEKEEILKRGKDGIDSANRTISQTLQKVEPLYEPETNSLILDAGNSFKELIYISLVTYLFNHNMKTFIRRCRFSRKWFLTSSSNKFHIDESARIKYNNQNKLRKKRGKK